MGRVTRTQKKKQTCKQRHKFNRMEKLRQTFHAHAKTVVRLNQLFSSLQISCEFRAIVNRKLSFKDSTVISWSPTMTSGQGLGKTKVLITSDKVCHWLPPSLCDRRISSWRGWIHFRVIQTRNLHSSQNPQDEKKQQLRPLAFVWRDNPRVHMCTEVSKDQLYDDQNWL